MKLTFGFSPCPNDTFIFEAMVHGRIDTEGLEFDCLIADVEELNRRALSGSIDITKMSCFAYAYAARNYLILDSGSALGRRNGPLLIAKTKIKPEKIAGARIAIPGKYTTANLLFSLAWPDALNKTEYLFSDIPDAILRGEADAGLIIHETRFTYQTKGLVKIADMGRYWEDLTGLPIPLGIIGINRNIPPDIALKVNSKSNAREISGSVISNHIKLYVNKYSLNLRSEGKRAITELFRIASGKGITPELPPKIFLTT
jgi:1,4-dihydroxy-6-naphthoate synthase